ncbi:MAG: hypothetical protein IPJ97_18345 [Proteobacteria bacterium]|nr:hypothetical protein [Pseudomonadota bacterium]
MESIHVFGGTLAQANLGPAQEPAELAGVIQHHVLVHDRAKAGYRCAGISRERHIERDWIDDVQCVDVRPGRQTSHAGVERAIELTGLEIESVDVGVVVGTRYPGHDRRGARREVQVIRVRCCQGLSTDEQAHDGHAEGAQTAATHCAHGSERAPWMAVITRSGSVVHGRGP